MKKETYYNETDPARRIEELKECIQQNYDNYNWYGNARYQKLVIAAQVELIGLGVTDFKPEYNCPA